jgi:hypothetical protein
MRCAHSLHEEIRTREVSMVAIADTVDLVEPAERIDSVERVGTASD